MGQDPTASRHARAAVPLARDILFRLGTPPLLRDHVVYLVRYHTLPFVFGSRPGHPTRLLRLAWTLDTRLLYLLALASCRIRNLPPTHRDLASVVAFRERCEQLGVFGREPPPLLPTDQWDRLAPTDSRLRRRLAGELRFWRLKGMVNDPEQAAVWLQAQSPAPAATLFLPVGIPGSGKSTWVARNLPGTQVISMDEMRERLLGERGDQRLNPQIYARCRSQLARTLRSGTTVVWDAQSHTWASRQGLLALARETHAYVVMIYLDVPLKVALERNAQRAAVVPEAVIRRSYEDLQEPRLFEAEEVWRVDVHGQRTRYIADETVGA